MVNWIQNIWVGPNMKHIWMQPIPFWGSTVWTDTSKGKTYPFNLLYCRLTDFLQEKQTFSVLLPRLFHYSSDVASRSVARGQHRLLCRPLLSPLSVLVIFISCQKTLTVRSLMFFYLKKKKNEWIWIVHFSCGIFVPVNKNTNKKWINKWIN